MCGVFFNRVVFFIWNQFISYGNVMVSNRSRTREQFLYYNSKVKSCSTKGNMIDELCVLCFELNRIHEVAQEGIWAWGAEPCGQLRCPQCPCLIFLFFLLSYPSVCSLLVHLSSAGSLFLFFVFFYFYFRCVIPVQLPLVLGLKPLAV